MRNIFASALVGLILNVLCIPSARAQQPVSKEEKHIQKIKERVAQLKRSPPDDPITVRLLDGTETKGYIVAVADDHFMLSDPSGRQPIRIDFLRVKAIGQRFGTKSKIALGVAGVIGGMFAIAGICLALKRCTE